jgi:hypothetical protein
MSSIRIRTALILVSALSLALLAACGAGEQPVRILVERVDSAGIELVTSPGEDLDLDWTMHRLFTLGGQEEGPESFYAFWLRSVGTDRAGRIYVLDTPDFRIVVFDSTGRFIRTLGGEGGGPGEMKRPNTLSVSPEGTVSIFDFGKGGLVRFDADGAVLPEERFEHFPMPNRQRHFAEASHGFVVSTMSTPKTADDELNERSNQLRSFQGADTTTLVEVPLPPSEMVRYERCGGGLRLPPLFLPEIIWDGEDDQIVVSSGPEYMLAIFHGGTATRSIRRAIAPARATRELAIAELGEGFKIDFGRGPCTISPQEMTDGRGYADVVPVILNVLLSPEGEVWVERRVGGGVAGSRIDIFDPTGAYLGTLPAGTPFPLMLLPGGRIAVEEKDEFDVARLVIMRVERAGA